MVIVYGVMGVIGEGQVAPGQALDPYRYRSGKGGGLVGAPHTEVCGIGGLCGYDYSVGGMWVMGEGQMAPGLALDPRCCRSGTGGGLIQAPHTKVCGMGDDRFLT